MLSNKNIISTELSKKEIFLNEWIDTNHRIKAIEESITLGSYEKTLTVITTNTLYEDVEEVVSDAWEPPSFK